MSTTQSPKTKRWFPRPKTPDQYRLLASMDRYAEPRKTHLPEEVLDLIEQNGKLLIEDIE